jgi:carbamoyl-phosphate synthase large subunit
MNIPHDGTILITVADKDKEEAGQLAQGFAKMGYLLCATSGTASYLRSLGLDVETVYKLREKSPHIIDRIKAGEIKMVINTLTKGKEQESDGFKIRRATVEHAIPCLTSIDTAVEVQQVLSVMRERRLIYALALQDYVGGGDSLA